MPNQHLVQQLHKQSTEETSAAVISYKSQAIRTSGASTNERKTNVNFMTTWIADDDNRTQVCHVKGLKQQYVTLTTACALKKKK